jgi:hypothetical protein
MISIFLNSLSDKKMLALMDTSITYVKDKQPLRENTCLNVYIIRLNSNSLQRLILSELLKRRCGTYRYWSSFVSSLLLF